MINDYKLFLLIHPFFKKCYQIKEGESGCNEVSDRDEDNANGDKMREIG